MAITTSPVAQHWNYFLALEDDLNRLARYLELAEANFSAYSIELARLLFSAASEVDVVAKQLCQRLQPNGQADNINAYRLGILSAHPEIAQSTVSLPKFGLTLTPWEQWGVGANPVWWRAYNNVKHHRHTHFAEASLKNTLNSLAGLFALLLFFYKDEAHNGTLSPQPTLFRITAPFNVETLFFSDATVYRLPPPIQG